MILTNYMSIILYIVAIVDKLHVNILYIVAIAGLTFSFSFFTQSSELFIFQAKELMNSFWKLSGIVVVISLWTSLSLLMRRYLKQVFILDLHSAAPNLSDSDFINLRRT